MLARRLLPWLPCALVVSSLAAAEEVPGKTFATDLFDRGLKKMAEGKCDEPTIVHLPACTEARDLFRKAYDAYPAGLGALRNLAYVERGLGLLASAARRFRELERKAPLDPNPKRHVWGDFARKELDRLEPLVPHLTVQVAAARPKSLQVVLDGAPLPEAVLGTVLDLDPGEHTLHAEAPGRVAFDDRFVLRESDAKVVELDLALVPPPPAPKTLPSPASRDDRAGSRFLPLAVVGVGGALVLTGLGFGVAAWQRRSEACGSSKVCEPHGLDAARTNASTANVLTVVGLAVAAGGVAWLYLAPANALERVSLLPTISPSAGGMVATVKF